MKTSGKSKMSSRGTTRANAYVRFMSLTPAQREAELAQYDQEWTGPGLPGKPLTAADKALHRRAAARGARAARAEKARNKNGPADRSRTTTDRSDIAAGAKIVPVPIERGLLKQADAFARRHKIQRAQMIAQGLRLVMQRAKAG